MNISLTKRLLPTLLLIALLLLLYTRGRAQQTETAKDSVTRSVYIHMLEHQFQIAGDWYKIQKFRLPATAPCNADSLFLKCVADYKKLYAGTPQQKLPLFFSDHFYDTVIPVVQYFRSPALAGLFQKDQARLHPKPATPDPKHHDQHHDEHQNDKQHSDK